MQKILIPTLADWLLTDAEEKIDQIKQAAGVRPEVWQAFFVPMLHAFADHVQRLPLSRDVFNGERGALDFGLASALIALRVASGQVFFPNAGSEDRRVLEPQCYFAAFVAALCSSVALVAEKSLVRAHSGAEYHVLVAPSSLHHWLSQHGESMMQWRVDEPPLTSAQCAAIGARVIPAGLLANFDLRVSLMIFGAIAPREVENGVESTLSKVIRLSTTRVLQHQVSVDRKRFETPDGSAPRPSVIDVAAMGFGGPAASPAPSVDGAQSVPSGQSSATTEPAQTTALPGQEMEKAELRLSKAERGLQQWFAAMRQHEKFPDFLSKLKRTDRGVEVPITTLNMLGLSAPMVRAMLTKAEFIIDRTADAKGIVLHPDLTPFFFDPVPQ